ncbi:Predicted transmembrane/coiled-coil 2 protein family-containing protein [Strongyloides ratti]|uniref:Predicted transmembrane/coiled-coil 2 protein family-containing protein n=1 Tax=Strongyloides ratti TaxID=34506 RepID=A0A090L7T5_STRRB|nr:Predicted transmembrane/coiled-coil 2 protein family-containing protein [Strongyloides ratti]CEF63580.1 Predicted transmembrane/coiled-coil 2 protein family-containing protein [Strongyloides ratti]
MIESSSILASLNLMGHSKRIKKIKNIMGDLSNDRVSMKSSDGGGNESGSGLGDYTFNSSAVYDDRLKLEEEIQSVKRKIAELQLQCEQDVEEFLKTDRQFINNPKNPQATRLKQHFDTRNKKNKKNLESLTKRLEILEQNLFELDSNGSGSLYDSSVRGKKQFLSNMSSNILKTGANVKEMTENVIFAPKNIAKAISGSARKYYGSTDNIDKKSDGNSIFYPELAPPTYNDRVRSLPNKTKFSEPQTEITHSVSSEEALQSIDNESHHVKNVTNLPCQRDSSSSITKRQFDTSTIINEISELKKIIEDIKLKQENYVTSLQNENKILFRTMDEEKFKLSKIEESLFELIELHQNENRKLKDDLNSISRRMDYQYNDRFSKLEEAIEGSNNRMLRIERNIIENNRNTSRMSDQCSTVSIAIINLAAEFLKIILYAISILVEGIRGIWSKMNPLIATFLIIIIILAIFNPYSLIELIFGKKKSFPQTKDDIEKFSHSLL